MRVLLIISICCCFLLTVPIFFESNDFDENDTRISQTRISPFSSINSNYFIQNNGQINNSEVLFYSNNNNFYFTKNSVYLRFYDFSESIGSLPIDIKERYKVSIIKLEFNTTNKIIISGAGNLNSNSNFFFSNNQDRWVSNVRSYNRIEYSNIWDGIDIEYYFFNGSLKYEFHLAPYANPDDIKIKVFGQDSIENLQDQLLFKINEHIIGDKELNTYYKNKTTRSIDSSFILCSLNEYSFKLSEYDQSLEVVIDPIIFSTYIGRGDFLTDAGEFYVDDSGDCYISGITGFDDFPLTPGTFYQETDNFYDQVFIVKLSSDGKSVDYSTYFGGSNDERISGIVVDDNGNAIIAGYTESVDYPVTEDCLKNRSDKGSFPMDAFVTKINSDGSDLIFSTYLGGWVYDTATGIAIDDSNCPIIIGKTKSYDFPTTEGVYKENLTSYGNGFICKLSPDGKTVEKSTITDSVPEQIAFDSKDNVYITGYVGKYFRHEYSINITSNAFDKTMNGIRDIYLQKLSSDFTQLLYSTYLGGSQLENAYSIIVEKEDVVYIAGNTNSSDFPITDTSFDIDYRSDYDGFILQMDIEKSELLFSTYIGGAFDDTVTDMSIDNNGNIYITGLTDSPYFPITGYLDDSMTERRVSRDCFIGKISPNGTRLVYSVLLREPDTIPYSASHTDDVGEKIHYQNPDQIYVYGKFDGYRVTTNDAYNQTPMSYGLMVIKIQLLPPPPAPENLSIKNTADGILIEWNPASDHDGSTLTNYSIYKKHNEDEWRQFAFVNSSETSYLDDWVGEGRNYSYKVCGINEGHEGNFSNSEKIMYEEIEEAKSKNENNIGVAVLVILFVIILIILFFLFMNRRKQQSKINRMKSKSKK